MIYEGVLKRIGCGEENSPVYTKPGGLKQHNVKLGHGVKKTPKNGFYSSYLVGSFLSIKI